MSRLATLVLVLSLGFAACAHEGAAQRPDVATLQNDGPVISPWYGPVPNDAIYAGGSGR